MAHAVAQIDLFVLAHVRLVGSPKPSRLRRLFALASPPAPPSYVSASSASSAPSTDGRRHDAGRDRCKRNGPRVIRNKASIEATVKNAQEVLAVLDAYGSILPAGSFPDARAA